MLIEIDLEEASSDDLAEHLKVLISQWQKHLKVPKPPEKDFRFGHKTFQKILITRLSSDGPHRLGTAQQPENQIPCIGWYPTP